MRMWMVPPRTMCRRHLLGEHVECHMLLGALRQRRSMRGYLERRLYFPEQLAKRHAELAREMRWRGFAHRSPLTAADERAVTVGGLRQYWPVYTGEVELRRRCRACALLRNIVPVE